MLGGLIIVVFLIAVVPPAIAMTMAAVAAGLGALLKTQVDSQHEGSELLELTR